MRAKLAVLLVLSLVLLLVSLAIIRPAAPVAACDPTVDPDCSGPLPTAAPTPTIALPCPSCQDVASPVTRR